MPMLADNAHAQFSRFPAYLVPVSRTADGGDGDSSVVVVQVPGDDVGVGVEALAGERGA